MDTSEVGQKIKELEEEMNRPDFWLDKEKARAVVRELAKLKNKKEGLGKYERGNAILSIVSGAGGDDAEDFSRLLLEMYMKYAQKNNFEVFFIHENKNDHEGYRNVSMEIGNPTLRSPLAKGRVACPRRRGEGSNSGPYGLLKKDRKSTR